MYRKEIIYMGMYKDGNRLGSAGFLKVEDRGNESSLYLKVKNIPHAVEGRFPVRLYNGTDWKEVDGIALQEGDGQWERSVPGSMNQMRLQIFLPDGSLIEGTSKAAGQKTDRGLQEKNGSAVRADRREEGGSTLRSDRGEEIENAARADGTKENMSEISRAGESRPERDILEAGRVQEGQAGADRAEDRRREESREGRQAEKCMEKQRVPERIAIQKQNREVSSPMADEMRIDGVKEDKWEQILDTYDRIHPYGDERVYVKLEPKDFVILQAGYQHLVNNSFLLHGYYNYRYVILGREDDYYLGVPGVFYEREKMVALMFGFEAFECSNGEAKAGEFGYYLRRVEL